MHVARNAKSSQRARSAWLLVALAAWTLFAFAGAYLWTVLPLVAGALLLMALVRPTIARRGNRTVDLALIACLLVIGFQLVPLPAALRLALSPRVGAVDHALWLGTADNGLPSRPQPLSIDVGATRLALTLAVAFGCVFWSARAIVSRGDVRIISRGIAWTGLALATVALAQHASAPELLYWSEKTVFGAPFGPYRNRNDFASWLILALPTTVGYIAARVESRRRGRRGVAGLVNLLDGTAVWLAGSVCLMAAALLTSLSRSGLMGAGAGLLSFLWLSRDRVTRSGRLRLIAAAALILAIALTYVEAGALSSRLEETIAAGIGGRQTIWRETWRMVRDFWITGVGAGAYQRGMLVYQQTRSGFTFNHAHDEYLQLIAEGGCLLLIPVAVALTFGAGQIRTRLHADRTPVFWIRVGAASGIVAIAVQSIWDTGLRMPANAVLFTLLAALALHQPEHRIGIRD